MIKAITTEYAGCKFRSRQEARWAVFFDALGIEWEYEKEGFELPSGKYLPDFWLPKERKWAEVKGQDFTPAEIQKCKELTEMTGHPCLMLSTFGRTVWATEMIDEPEALFVDYDLSYWNRDGRFYVWMGLKYPNTQQACYGDECAGVKAAKSARFEFGQNKRIGVQPMAKNMIRYDF